MGFVWFDGLGLGIVEVQQVDLQVGVPIAFGGNALIIFVLRVLVSNVIVKGLVVLVLQQIAQTFRERGRNELVPHPKRRLLLVCEVQKIAKP